MKYIQCPHCNAFMSIYGLSSTQAKWNCQNEKCGKPFWARIVHRLEEWVEVVKKEENEKARV